MDHFYTSVVGKYWNAERKIVEESYKNILFPLDEIIAPDFEIKTEWNFEQLIGYLSSWSAVNKYERVTGQDPLKLIEPDILKAWGNKQTYSILFPIFLRIGKIIKF